MKDENSLKFQSLRDQVVLKSYQTPLNKLQTTQRLKQSGRLFSVSWWRRCSEVHNIWCSQAAVEPRVGLCQREVEEQMEQSERWGTNITSCLCIQSSLDPWKHSELISVFIPSASVALTFELFRRWKQLQHKVNSHQRLLSVCAVV